jgi:glycosyltransferase involved in cell wall biosynthesis
MPETTRLDTIPFAAHILRQLATTGWHIDVFLWSKPDSSNQIDCTSDYIRYKHVSMYNTRRKLKLAELTLRFARYITYKCVFSVGRIGSYFGGIISIASRCPFVLLNDEFPSIYDQSRWLALERWGARRADVIVVPSDDRYRTLREELRLNADKPLVTIRNTPELTLPLIPVDWHRLMGIPYGKKIFINAGTINDWAQVPEILASVSYWPKDAVLLLHNSRAGDEFVRYRKWVSHLDNPERVFWSSSRLPEDKLNSLISSCSGSFALYRNDGPNTEQVGTSSGKLMRSIVCGTPVIASSFESLKFVTIEGLGIQVTHPAEISAAIDNLMRNRESYRERCLRFASSEKSLREQACIRS